MTTELFKVGSVDYTNHIVAGSYDINLIKKYKEWTDGFGAGHRDQRVPKVEGSLDIAFRTAEEYRQFLNDLENAKYNAEYQYSITVKPNNVVPEVSKTIHAFVDFKPVRDLNGVWNDRFPQFTIEIKES